MSEIISEQEYRRLKQEVEESKAQAQRAKGALGQLMTQLKEEFNCESLKEAKTLLADLGAKRDKFQRKYDEAVTAYQKKWKNETNS